MSTLTFIFPEVIDIVSLYSTIKRECERLSHGEIQQHDLIQSTSEIKDRLDRKTKKLFETIEILGKSNEKLTRDCLNLSKKITDKAGRISYWLDPSHLDINHILTGIEEIESSISLLGNVLCSHYDRMATDFKKEKMLSSCYEKVFASIRNHPLPVFESEIEEYSEIAEGITVSYPEPKNERFTLNRKILEFPGVFNFLMSLENADKRNRLIKLIEEYDEGNPSAILPLTNEIATILPCIGVLDLRFSSEKELRQDFIRFFTNGNWLEAYAYFMLDRAGCSTRLLNVNLSCESVLLEVDVLALFRGRFFIFETKDRSGSDGFTDNDRSIIEEQMTKIAKLRGVSTIYVINSKDEHHELMRSQIEELASSKGVSVEILFLSNSGIDNLVAKLRSSLR